MSKINYIQLILTNKNEKESDKFVLRRICSYLNFNEYLRVTSTCKSLYFEMNKKTKEFKKYVKVTGLQKENHIVLYETWSELLNIKQYV
jgi:hypothetical protein